MRGINTSVTKLRRKIFVEVAKVAYLVDDENVMIGLDSDSSHRSSSGPAPKPPSSGGKGASSFSSTVIQVSIVSFIYYGLIC